MSNSKQYVVTIETQGVEQYTDEELKNIISDWFCQYDNCLFRNNLVKCEVESVDSQYV